MKAWLLVALLVIPPSAASAFTSLDIARRVIPTFSEIYIDASSRKSMALVVQEYWADFDRKLPRLSPAEQKWVEGELNTTESSRLSRIMSTKEYHLWALAGVVDNCKVVVARVINTQNDPTLATSEMFEWLKVANCYHQSNGNVFEHLNGAGIRQETPWEAGYGLDNMILGSILNVVIPSAMADTMGWTLSRAE
jgi:hypothetical protein